MSNVIQYKKTINIFILITVCSFAFCGEIYRERATVSYYAGDFNGKKTSNGEYFNMNDLTCASKSLPFDTILKITNRANGKSVQVRVNDRGPFVEGRELDLSKAAAQKLDMIKSGTATVRIEIIKRGPDTKISKQTAEKAAQIMAKKSGGQTPTISKPQKSQESKQKLYPEGKHWDIQIGAYSTRENANKMAQKLLKDGFQDVVFQKGNEVFRVVIRSVPSNKVSSLEKKLNSLGYTGYVIKQRKE